MNHFDHVHPIQGGLKNVFEDKKNLKSKNKNLPIIHGQTDSKTKILKVE